MITVMRRYRRLLQVGLLLVIAAFVLTAILGGGAFYLLKRGAALLSPSRLKPEQTLATLRRHDHG